MVEDPDDVFTQEGLLEGDVVPFFTTDDRSFIITGWVRLSKTVPSSGSGFASLLKRVGDELRASQAASAETEKTFSGRRNWF